MHESAMRLIQHAQTVCREKVLANASVIQTPPLRQPRCLPDSAERRDSNHGLHVRDAVVMFAPCWGCRSNRGPNDPELPLYG